MFQIDEKEKNTLFAGCHRPDGALWFGTGRHRVHDGKVSILDMLPTLLAEMGIDHAPSEAYPFRGRRLPLHAPADGVQAPLPAAAE